MMSTPRQARAAARRWFGPSALGLAAVLAGVWILRSQPRAIRRAPGLNVLLVTLDTLRADALGSYGSPKGATPLMDRLAATGVRFARAHAHNVVTLPSHANILSGRYPFEHGVRDNTGFRFPPRLDTLATLLKARGYRTGAFVSAFPLHSRFGLDRGFDVYDDRLSDPEAKPMFEMQERAGRTTVAAAVEWMRSAPGSPYFCWVHLYDPHAPYRPPPEIGARFPDDDYAGEVAATDAALEPLLGPILAAPDGGRTLVVLTADHGESLGEHGEMTHGIFTYEATLRVPLILHGPALLSPAVVEAAARHVDLLPTVLDALALPVPNELPGRSLLPAAAGVATAVEPSYFESLSPALNRGWAPAHGVLRGPWKYIDLPLPELYDLRADAGEASSLAAREPQEVARLQGLLAGYRARDQPVVRLEESPEVRERLAALGYTSAGAPALKEHFTLDDDPKRLMHLDKAVHEAIELYRAGDLAGSRRLYEQVVAQRPDMPLAYVHLASVARESGDLEAAVAAGRKAVALDPASSETAAALGSYLNESGRAAETIRLLEPYAQASEPDFDVLIALGVAYAHAGRPAAALSTLERARRMDPADGMALLNIGTVHLMAGDRARARRYFQDALARQPDLARAYNSLGVIEAESGRPEEAIRLWQKAAALNPRAADTLFNLGVILRRQGRHREARAYLQEFLRTATPALHADDIRRARAWVRSPV